MTIKETLFESLKRQYESQILESQATLMIYMENPVGIGEHPQHIEEMDKYVEKLTNATDKLEKLKQFYKDRYGN